MGVEIFEWRHVISSMQPIATVQSIHTGPPVINLRQAEPALVSLWPAMVNLWPPTDLWLQAEYVYLYLNSL